MENLLKIPATRRRLQNFPFGQHRLNCLKQSSKLTVSHRLFPGLPARPQPLLCLSPTPSLRPNTGALRRPRGLSSLYLVRVGVASPPLPPHTSLRGPSCRALCAIDDSSLEFSRTKPRLPLRLIPPASLQPVTLGASRDWEGGAADPGGGKGCICWILFKPPSTPTPWKTGARRAAASQVV